MVAGKYKSRTFRKVFVKTPGGKTVVHYRKRKPSPAVCGVTGQKLHGIIRVIASKVRNLSITQKTNSRPFGGSLSSKAMRSELKSRISIETVEGTGIEVGRMCMKIAGRDAGNICVIVDMKKGITIDGNVRRKKVNLNHIQPLGQLVKLTSGSHEEVEKAFKELKLPIWNKKKKTISEKPKRTRTKKVKKITKKETKKNKKPVKTEKNEVKTEKPKKENIETKKIKVAEKVSENKKE